MVFKKIYEIDSLKFKLPRVDPKKGGLSRTPGLSYKKMVLRNLELVERGRLALLCGWLAGLPGQGRDRGKIPSLLFLFCGVSRRGASNG